MPAAPHHLPEHDACGIAVVADRQGRRSREIVERGLEALTRLAHRGAIDAAGRSSDGAGILAGIPWDLFAPELPPALADPAAHRIAAMFALHPEQADRAVVAARSTLRRLGWRVLSWRRVPMESAAVLPHARATAPLVMQCFARAPRHEPKRSAYRTRLAIEARWRRLRLDGCTVSSLSEHTIVYKGLVDPAALPRLYPDLGDPRFTSSFAILHQRFSTNTWPRWDLAQPFHTIAHNGEINTIGGNRLWMDARIADADIRDDSDLVRRRGSDSQTVDAAVQWLHDAGLSTPRALARLMPPAWEHDHALAEPVRAFYRHEACYAEPWDGPAAIAFADGRHVGALVDRNGFRPLRTIETEDGLVCVASEAGVFDLPAPAVVDRGRLGPGEMLVVDLTSGAVLRGESLAADLAAQEDYTARTAATLRALNAPEDGHAAVVPSELHRQHQLFGWTREEIELIVRPLASDGQEAVGSMGDDATLAALTSRPRPLSDYFRQRFAQVTNPPIDPLRESHVMSLRALLGRRGQWAPGSLPPVLLEIDSPVLREAELSALLAQQEVRAAVLNTGFEPSLRGLGLQAAVDALQETACAMVSSGTRILVLSDRALDRHLAPIPALLATAAVDDALRSRRLRLRASLVVDSGEIRDAHQVATLCGFGASAVLPRLLYSTAAALSDIPAEDVNRARAALESGLLKIMSKMGVCTFEAYAAGRLFDVIGLDPAFAAAYFGGGVALPGRLTLEHVAGAAVARYEAAARQGEPLAHPGFHTFRRAGDHHAFNPALVRRLHAATGQDGGAAYATFAALAAGRPASAVRDLLDFASRAPVPIDEVEPAGAICRRFFASAMSVGALSPEAHRTIAAAMNSIGARSNSGEGGEEPERLRPHEDASTRSATKQVASARFGVTPAYLISATELQIKMAQGSKPGEGGQLPAAKVDAAIARLRHTQPGTTLISPPPHHDIYSIEDLAQLIYDLRAFHPRARINVKLVAQPGIGVVAAGVVKAGADAIQISGHEGGTGASPRGSIKHAGSPWEIGLVEAHQTLVASGLRDRVVLQTDGGLQTGRDVTIAAALGADEFGFGTAALVAVGCVMARQCHLNTCPVGIATQRSDLRARYAGTPDMLVRYLRLLAEDVRRILASLGLRSVSELVGRSDLLVTREPAGSLDLAPLLQPVQARKPTRLRLTRRSRRPADDLNAALARATRARLGTAPVTFIGKVQNTDRAVGAALAGRLAAETGNAGTARAPVELRLSGSAGQSLWAFALPGMHVRIEGEANDGVGKGMHGGEIVIRPPAGDRVAAPVLVGNAALYGATGGRLFVAGRAGERFAVRNSGAWAVVEGLGDHGCEYMTAGAVLVLGPVGRNFAAGMTGGIAYVLDGPGSRLGTYLNAATVERCRGVGEDESRVRAWVAEHHERTGSAVAAALLRDWRAARERFWAIVPKRVASGAPAAPPLATARAGEPEAVPVFVRV